MTALYIILGIIAFFVSLLSIKFTVTVHYENDVAVSVQWLFLKFEILPKKEKEKPQHEQREPSYDIDRFMQKSVDLVYDKNDKNA